MHYLIHGDYHLQSRLFLKTLIDSAKSKGMEIIQLNGEQIVINDFIQATSNFSLFNSQSLIVIENFLSRKKSKETEKLWQYLKDYQGQTEFILWEKKAIGKILQRNLPTKTTVKEFKTPILVFKLVEQINPNSKSQALTNLETVLQKAPAEFIFAMIIRQTRSLLQIKFGNIPDGAPWMIGKLKSQATYFKQDQLEKAYTKLYQIDKANKTGATPVDLSWQLSFWLATL